MISCATGLLLPLMRVGRVSTPIVHCPELDKLSAELYVAIR